MKPPRPPFAGSMIVAGVVVANAAAARVLFARNSEMLIGVALSGAALQFAAYRFVRAGERARAFWAGFLGGGLIAAASFAWAMTFPEVLGLDFDPSNGSMELIRTPGSPLYTVWHGYASLVGDWIVLPVFQALNIHIDPETVTGGAPLMVARAVIWSLPQGFAALIGGLLAVRLVSRRRGRDVPPAAAGSVAPVA